jgi:hypothetical protein
MKSSKIGGARIVVVAIGILVAALAYADGQGSAAGQNTGSAARSASIDQSTRLATEAAIGRTDVIKKLEAAMGDGFGGVWFEASTLQLHVGVTSPASRQAAEAVAARVGLSANVTETPVRSTRAQLGAEQKRLSHRLADLFSRGEVSTSIAPDNNAVEVELGSDVPQAEREALERETAQADANVLIHVAPQPHLRATPLKQCGEHEKSEAYCDPTIVAGVSLVSTGEARCTVGPAVRLTDRSTLEKATKTYILTAGHCIDSEKGGGLGADWFSWDKGGKKEEIGSAVEFLNAETDVGVIEVNNPGFWVAAGFTPVTPSVAMWSKTEETDPTEVTAQQKPAKGTETCYSGQTSGTNCGKILNESVEKELEPKVITKNLVEVELGTGEGGDSGAPFFKKAAPSEVEGTLVAGSATRTYFHSLETSFSKLTTKLELLKKGNKTRHPNKLKSEGTPTVLTGKQHAGNDVVTIDAGTLSCNEATYTGEAVGTEVVEVTVTPTYSECKVFGFLAATVDTNGCQYKFSVLEKEESNFEGSVDLVCPEGKKMEVTAPGCRVTIGPQSNLKKVTYTNLGSGATREVTVDVSLTGIAYEEHKVSPSFSCANETGATNNGKFEASALVTGETGGGTHRGIWVE